MAKRRKTRRRTAFVPRIVFATAVGTAVVPLIAVTACEDDVRGRHDDDDGSGGFTVAAVAFGGFSVAGVGFGGFSVAAVAFGAFGGTGGVAGTGGTGGVGGTPPTGGSGGSGGGAKNEAVTPAAGSEPAWAQTNVGEGPLETCDDTTPSVSRVSTPDRRKRRGSRG